MSTAVDSSCLLAVFNHEAGWQDWQELMRRALSEGPLLVCPVVFAEVSIGFASTAATTAALGHMGVQISPFSEASAWLAGRMFLEYRRAGGPRAHLIPDFMIAAHAQSGGHSLLATDRGYLRAHFPNLTIINPENAS